MADGGVHSGSQWLGLPLGVVVGGGAAVVLMWDYKEAKVQAYGDSDLQGEKKNRKVLPPRYPKWDFVRRTNQIRLVDHKTRAITLDECIRMKFCSIPTFLEQKSGRNERSPSAQPSPMLKFKLNR